jgi:transposase
VVGIDVSKARLDVAFRPSAQRLTGNNSSRGIIRLANGLKNAPQCVLLEATGGYEIKLLERLLAEKLPVVVGNARQVREFARATGRLAKTDAIDADSLAHYAEALKPKQRALPDLQTRKLRALLTRRRQLLGMIELIEKPRVPINWPHANSLARCLRPRARPLRNRTGRRWRCEFEPPALADLDGSAIWNELHGPIP